MEHVVGEIQVVPCKCTPYVIFLLVPALSQLLEFRHDQVIASFAVPERTHPVVHFPAPVQAQDHVVHLPVYELLHLIIEEHAVGGKREPEMLVMDLLLLPAIGYQVFHDLPVHQRLAAEEIHFQVPALPGIRDQEIQRFLSHFIGHQRPAPVVFAFFREAVFTRQVAVVGDVETERLHHRLPLLHFVNIVFIYVPREQTSLLCQRGDRFQDVRQIFL